MVSKYCWLLASGFAVTIPLSAAKADGQRIIPRLEGEAQASFNVQPALPWVAPARSSAPLSDAKHYIIVRNGNDLGR